MEAIPLSETSTAARTKALNFTWISHFGVPEAISFDRRPQFTSNLWFQLCEMFNISQKQTTAYHPESNGTVERLHRHHKDALRACAAAATWSEELPFVLLGLGAQPREDTGLFPAEVVFSAQIVLPNEFLQMMNFQLMLLSNIFPKPCMFLLLLCLGTILALTCSASCQPSCSPPPHLGPPGRHHSTHSAALQQPLRSPAPQPPLLPAEARTWGEPCGELATPLVTV